MTFLFQADAAIAKMERFQKIRFVKEDIAKVRKEFTIIKEKISALNYKLESYKSYGTRNIYFEGKFRVI